jgi:hypothetical protein
VKPILSLIYFIYADSKKRYYGWFSALFDAIHQQQVIFNYSRCITREYNQLLGTVHKNWGLASTKADLHGSVGSISDLKPKGLGSRVRIPHRARFFMLVAWFQTKRMRNERQPLWILSEGICTEVFKERFMARVQNCYSPIWIPFLSTTMNDDRIYCLFKMNIITAAH